MSGMAVARPWLARWWNMCTTQMRLRRACFVASGAAHLMCRLPSAVLCFSTLHAAADEVLLDRQLFRPSPYIWLCCAASAVLPVPYQ